MLCRSFPSCLVPHTPIEFGFTFCERLRLSILFGLISNAYLADPNEGLDLLGVRYGFQI